MRDKPPPGPYTMGYSGPATNGKHRYMVIYDADSRVILSVFGQQTERLALVEMIIAASQGKNKKPTTPSAEAKDER